MKPLGICWSSLAPNLVAQNNPGQHPYQAAMISWPTESRDRRKSQFLLKITNDRY